MEETEALPATATNGNNIRRRVAFFMRITSKIFFVFI